MEQFQAQVDVNKRNFEGGYAQPSVKHLLAFDSIMLEEMTLLKKMLEEEQLKEVTYSNSSKMEFVRFYAFLLHMRIDCTHIINKLIDEEFLDKVHV